MIPVAVENEWKKNFIAQYERNKFRWIKLNTTQEITDLDAVESFLIFFSTGLYLFYYCYGFV